MGTFDHLQRKRTIASTPVIQTPSLLRPSRQPAPLPPSQLDAPVTQAQSGRARPLEYSFDRISIFPPAKKNDTGLPDSLKAGVENLSGLSLDDVHVHYNSSKPAQVQALAYTQGMNIHVGPGQEKHLAHEAWHVVQQMQGRVMPTLQTKGVAINDDEKMEHEADMMGKQAAVQRIAMQNVTPDPVNDRTIAQQSDRLPIQCMPKLKQGTANEYVDADYPLLRLEKLPGSKSNEYRIIGTTTSIYYDSPNWYEDYDGTKKKDLSEYLGDPSKRKGISNDQGKSYYFEETKHTGGFLPIMEAYELAQTLNKEKQQGFDESKIKNVAREIELKQTIYPIELTRTATGLRLFQGRHRIAASLLKGLRTIPYNII
jgi:hypothetical protein